MSGSGSYVDVPDSSTTMGTPWDMINDRFDMSQAFATTAYATTSTYITQLAEMLKTLSVPTTSIDDLQMPEITPLNYIRRPNVSALELDTEIPTLDVARPIFSQVPSIPTMPEFNIGFSPPQWSAISKPVLNEIPAPGDAPGLVTPVIPPMPVIHLPEAPTLSAIVLPSAPESILPTFDAVKPSSELILPEPFAFNEPIYQSDLWTELMQKILTDIRNGGTGLDIDIENSIWSRAYARLLEEKAKALRAIETKFGPSGLDLPQGALAGAILDLESDWARKTEDQSLSIAIEQAKLAQTNTHFMVEQGIKCEGVLRQFFNDQNNRILEASKQIALVGIEVFKSTVALHNAKVEQYKAEASVFESRVRAAQQEIELYRSKVEGAKVSAEVQSLLVEIYQKQIQAVESQIKIYATNLENAKIQAEVNAAAIQAYKTHVDAYIARLTGEKLKLEIYEAEMNGEKSKADIYRSQVEAFSATISAEAKRTDVNIAVADSAIKQNVALVDLYKADLSAYTARIDAILKALSTKVTGFQAEVSAYNAETQAEASYYSVQEAEIDAKVKVATLQMQLGVAEMDAVIKSYTSLNTLRIEGLKGIMDVSAQLTASSLSAVHASASVGHSTSISSASQTSLSAILSEAHNFDETPT